MRDYNNMRGAAYTYVFGYFDDGDNFYECIKSFEPFKPCAICGGTPVGFGCYHICENSHHYYSAEQEREDTAWFDAGNDDRYDGWGDTEIYPELTDADVEVVWDSFEPVCYLGHPGCYDLHSAERRADEVDWAAERDLADNIPF